jgi:hypothetical protein
MISTIAIILMQHFALDPRPAYAAAWGVVVATAAILAFAVYLVLNGG